MWLVLYTYFLQTLNKLKSSLFNKKKMEVEICTYDVLGISSLDFLEEAPLMNELLPRSEMLDACAGEPDIPGCMDGCPVLPDCVSIGVPSFRASKLVTLFRSVGL